MLHHDSESCFSKCARLIILVYAIFTPIQKFCFLETFMSPWCLSDLLSALCVRLHVCASLTHHPFKAQTACLCLFTGAFEGLPPCFCSFAYFTRPGDSATSCHPVFFTRRRLRSQAAAWTLMTALRRKKVREFSSGASLQLVAFNFPNDASARKSGEICRSALRVN